MDKVETYGKSVLLYASGPSAILDLIKAIFWGILLFAIWWVHAVYFKVDPEITFRVMVFSGCIALFFFAYGALQRFFTRYIITEDFIEPRWGVLRKNAGEIKMYQIKDPKVEAPFYLAVFNYGHLILVSSDTDTPIFKLKAIYDPQTLMLRLRTVIQKARREEGVQEMDFYQR